jgi:hypothetical protein
MLGGMLLYVIMCTISFNLMYNSTTHASQNLLKCS